jgi:hypothetical protein
VLFLLYYQPPLWYSWLHTSLRRGSRVHMLLRLSLVLLLLLLLGQLLCHTALLLHSMMCHVLLLLLCRQVPHSHTVILQALQVCKRFMSR